MSQRKHDKFILEMKDLIKSLMTFCKFKINILNNEISIFIQDKDLLKTLMFFKDNPSFNSDGRLIDFVEPKIYQEGVKSPALAAILSIVPGLGRIYTGRFYDSFYSMINLVITWKVSSVAIETNRKILAPIFTTAFATLYIAEIYGSWRAAKYYQPHQKNKSNK